MTFTSPLLWVLLPPAPSLSSLGLMADPRLSTNPAGLAGGTGHLCHLPVTSMPLSPVTAVLPPRPPSVHPSAPRKEELDLSNTSPVVPVVNPGWISPGAEDRVMLVQFEVSLMETGCAQSLTGLCIHEGIEGCD